MRPVSLLRRRPSPAIVISVAALFLSLGGVGYAATQLPANSVGTAQLQFESVTYKKIKPSSVGNVRANTDQIQERVNGKCAPGSALGAVNHDGSVGCNSALPAHSGTTNNTAIVALTPTTVTAMTLAAGNSYLVLANPTASVTSGATAQHVSVTCALTVGSNTETRTITIDTDGKSGDTSTASVAMQAAGPSGAASVRCQRAAASPTVSVTSAIDAITVAS